MLGCQCPLPTLRDPSPSLGQQHRFTPTTKWYVRLLFLQEWFYKIQIILLYAYLFIFCHDFISRMKQGVLDIDH